MSVPALPQRWALLVIDMQNDFLHRDGYYAKRPGARTTPTANGLRDPSIEPVIDGVRTAVAAARAQRRPIAFVRAVYDRSFGVVPPSLTRNPQRKDFPCKPGTWGAQLIDSVAELVNDAPDGAKQALIDKHTYNCFHETVLSRFLSDCDVDGVALCGTETQVCVLASAQQAAFLGYRACIIEDAVWSPNPAMAQAGLAIFRDAYGDTVSARDLGAPA